MTTYAKFIDVFMSFHGHTRVTNDAQLFAKKKNLIKDTKSHPIFTMALSNALI